MKGLFYLTIGLGLVLAIALTSCNSSEDKPGQDVTVRMGQATWDTGWFQGQVYKALLEELGYSVRDAETVDNVAFYIFAAQGDLDFWANGWFPLHDRYYVYRDVATKVETVGYQVEGGALQGYMVDKATADKLGITNLGDLLDPEIATVFDNDGDGKADLVGCNSGWGCGQVIEHHLDSFDLRDTVSHVQGDYSALMTETITRYENGKSILFYTWTPNWTVSELAINEDVVWLSVPFSTLPDSANVNTEVETISGCLETPCDLGFGSNDIRVVANIDFLAANPAAVKLFELVEISLNDIAAQNVRMKAGEDSNEDLRTHAQAWIEANRDLVDQWLDAARNAAD